MSGLIGQTEETQGTKQIAVPSAKQKNSGNENIDGEMDESLHELLRKMLQSQECEYRYSNDMLYEGEAILISGNGSYTGRTIFINDAFDLYQRTYACVNKTDKDILLYIYYSMKRYFVPKVSGGTHGSAIPYIVYDDIAKEKIAVNYKVLSAYNKIIKPIQNKILKNERENQQLASLRDWLLPMLMNGQVGFEGVE